MAIEKHISTKYTDVENDLDDSQILTAKRSQFSMFICFWEEEEEGGGQWAHECGKNGQKRVRLKMQKRQHRNLLNYNINTSTKIPIL